MDSKAFIFSLNNTSQGSLFKKKVAQGSSSNAIFSSSSTGPTFGEAPFDFQIGFDGNMKEGTSYHSTSYRDSNSALGSDLTTILAGESNFTVSNIEVLFKAPGGRPVNSTYTPLCILSDGVWITLCHFFCTRWVREQLRFMLYSVNAEDYGKM